MYNRPPVYKKRSSNYVLVLFVVFLSISLGLCLSIISFINNFSVWYGQEEKVEKEKASDSYLGLSDKISTSKASVEFLAFSNAESRPILLSGNNQVQFPVGGPITSFYNSYHTGVDVGASYNSPVYPIMKGKVSKVVFNGGNLGRYIEISHKRGLKSLYAHLNIVAANKGQTVSLNTKIGSVGTTGFTSGPHVHLSVFKEGKSINPLILLQ